MATKSYCGFHAELDCLHTYLQSRLLPAEPEEVLIRGILLDLQNVLEHESEQLIEYHVKHNPTARNQNFSEKLRDGYVSFKTKFEWLKARHRLGSEECDVMEEIRILRNAFIHARPEEKRRRHMYFGKPLLCRSTVRRLFTDVEGVLLTLRSQSGTKSKWRTVPPGYASEMQWPAEAVAVLDRQ